MKKRYKYDGKGRWDHETDRQFFVRQRATGEETKLVLNVDPGYISCDMCACCYGAKGALDPVWCQVFSRHVEPTNFVANRAKATACPNYVPKFMDRSLVITPEVKRWYEDKRMF